LKDIQQEKFFFVARIIPPFYVNLRPDFCGSRAFSLETQEKAGKNP
jgi:hypothetical protein